MHGIRTLNDETLRALRDQARIQGAFCTAEACDRELTRRYKPNGVAA